MKHFFYFSLFISIYLLLNLQASAQKEKALEFIVEPYILDISDSSFKVSWETSVDATGTLYLVKSEYDILNPELKIATTENAPAHFHRLTVEGVKPNELYFYQVVNIAESGDTLKGPVTKITIPNYSQSAISFSVVGDTQGNPVVWKRIIELMAQKCPQFIVHVGDLVQYGPNKDDWTDEFFKPAHNLISNTPIYPAIGNHEMNNEQFYQYFDLPLNNAFYSIKKGGLRIIFVDTNKDILPGSGQYQKLEQLLGSSVEPWKVIVHHHPLLTADNSAYRSSMMAKPTKGDPNISHLRNLYETYAVDFILSGHVHGYERTWPVLKNHIDEDKGVTQFVTGGGGGRFKGTKYDNNWFAAEAKHVNHFLNVRIVKNKLQVEAIDTTGKIIDTWEKEKNIKQVLSAPLIKAQKKYFIDSTSVTIENKNKTGCINYRLNDGQYFTEPTKTKSLVLKSTTTVSALISDVNNESREIVKTMVKLPLLVKQKSSSKKITADYYEGHFTMLPDFDQLKPNATFSIDSILLSSIIPRVKDHFAVRFKGSFSIPEKDVYRFFLESYDGSRIFIDGEEIINNDAVHYEISKESFVALAQGIHNFELQYFDFTRRETLNLLVGTQGDKMFDFNMLIHSENK